MIIKGRRRGGAKNLADHLRRTDENEKVLFDEFEGFTFDKSDGPALELALKQMEAVGYAKGSKRNLYHAILAPAYGETLNAKQRQFMIDYYMEHMGFKSHQYALIEHWKKGKQHFHLAVNIIHPETGKINELKYTKYKEWRISRGLEEILGLSTPKPNGKEQPTWAIQRSKRSKVDPRQIRRDVTAIYNASKTTKEFIDRLDKAGLALSKGRRGQLVLVDMAGDTHGLMRMIESNKKLADLKKKFHGIDNLPVPSHEALVKVRRYKATQNPIKEVPLKPIDEKLVKAAIKAAYQHSKTGAQFFATLNKQQYSFGRSLKGFVVIDRNGGKHDIQKLISHADSKALFKKFSDLAALKPSLATELVRRMRLGQRVRMTRHPLRQAVFFFGVAARSIGRPAIRIKPVRFDGITALILRLYALARRNAAKEETRNKARQNRFPIIRHKKSKRDENELPKAGPTRAEIENAELLRYAFENNRYDILALFGINILPENPTIYELVRQGRLPSDALEP